MSMTADELASAIGAKVSGDGTRVITGCAGLDDAGASDLSFLANPKYRGKLVNTSAGAVVLSPGDEPNGTSSTLLVADDPYFAFRQAVVAIHGFRVQPQPGVSNQAFVDPTATIGEDCVISPFAYIAAGATIGGRTVIYPHCFIGENASVGEDCILYPNVTVYDKCVLGDRVILQAGCVIGEDGFGYATHQGAHHKIPQIGNTVIDDDVELGANCAIDRATVGSTHIGKGTKFSNLVTIGHGTSVGEHNLYVAQTGLAGSVTTGKYVVFGGQSGSAGHLEITDGVQVAARAAVLTSIDKPGKYSGMPAISHKRFQRVVSFMLRLPEMVKDMRQMKKRLDQIEARLDDSNE